jgi:hypothetical protein
MLSSAALVGVVVGGVFSRGFNSFSVGLTAVGSIAVGFGFVEVSGAASGGVEAKDLRTWAANSAQVAGRGRPGPMARCSVVEVVVGGAGSAGGWDWGVAVAEGCGAILGIGKGSCVGTGLCADTEFGAGAAFLASLRFWRGAVAAGGDAGGGRDLAFSRSASWAADMGVPASGNGSL